MREDSAQGSVDGLWKGRRRGELAIRRGWVSDLQVCCARALCLGGRKKDSCLHAVLGSGVVCSKILRRAKLWGNNRDPQQNDDGND